MDNFETPSWDGEKEAEKWSSDLIRTSKASIGGRKDYLSKVTKVHKHRKRNKYPKGFMKGINSSQASQKRKDMSIKEENQLTVDNPDNLGMTNSLSPKKKRKKHKKVKDSSESQKEIKGVCRNEENQDLTDNPNKLGSANSLSPKKKRKKHTKDVCVKAENQESTEKIGMSNSLPLKNKRRKHKEVTDSSHTPVQIKTGDQELPEKADKMGIANSLSKKRKMEEPNSIENDSMSKKKKKLTLREKMEDKLLGARFRFLNEQLYTSKSGDTNKFFHLDEKAFEAYHDGYKQQLEQWPVKPIDLIINNLKKKPSNYIIADFGCGEALIAQSLPNEVYSFDHVALNNHVTVCDMAHTPLKKGSVDVVVFCLSLMGSNLSDYICEANRVLKIGGLLKIAEVESRFDKVEKFIQIICKFGFLCIHKDLDNTYFYLFDFRKEKNLKEGKALPSIELRACYYKKR